MLFTFTYKHPHTSQLCTVDSGKPTLIAAFVDIVHYMHRRGLKKLAPKSTLQIKDESLRTVRSNHGILTIDTRGTVTRCHLDNDDADGGAHLAQIARFDIGEWQRRWGKELPESFDILDLGYWYFGADDSERYAPPDETWRVDIAEAMFDRRPAAGNGAAS
jgi:hypothetical protein